jgi:chitinase
MKTIVSGILLGLCPIALLTIAVSGTGTQPQVSGSGQPTGSWISGYYGSQNGVLPVSSIAWSKYTHIIHFAAAPGVDLNGNGDGSVELHWLSQADINAMIAARPAGKQVLVCIKDNDFHLGAFPQSTSPAMIATFVSNIVNFVNTNGYDGVDLDWEQNINVTQYNDLLTRLRNAMPAKVISMAVGNFGNLPSVAGASYSQVDQINLMCYDMDAPGNGFSWYNDALFQSGNFGVNTCDWQTRAFTNAGVTPSKIGIGIPFYGRRWPGVTYALVNGSFNPSSVLYRDLVSDGTRWQPQYQFYDSVYKADYLSIPGLNEFDSYNGTQSIKDAVVWQKSQGFGGFMTFTIDYEYLSSQVGDARYPLSTTLCAQVFGTCQ